MLHIDLIHISYTFHAQQGVLPTKLDAAVPRSLQVRGEGLLHSPGEQDRRNIQHTHREHQRIHERFLQLAHRQVYGAHLRSTTIVSQIPSKRQYAEQITTDYFQRFKHPNQFYIRALLVKARLVAQEGHLNNKKGEEMIAVLKEALLYTTKALDIITGGGG